MSRLVRLKRLLHGEGICVGSEAVGGFDFERGQAVADTLVAGDFDFEQMILQVRVVLAPVEVNCRRLSKDEALRSGK